MQTLIFNTTEKSVKLQNSIFDNSSVEYSLLNTPTVKMENGYYEVMQTQETTGKAIPVLRVPIANTNMIITK
jgi:hypothetical protein